MVDYIDINVWPVFNFADIMINVGVIMIILKIFEKEKEEIKEIEDEVKMVEGLEHVSNSL